MLLEFPDDVKLCIFAYLDVISLSNISFTCHELKTFMLKKPVWLNALENMRLRRPIPLPSWEQSSRDASAEVPVERLIEAVTRAAKVECNWSKDIIRPTRYEQRTQPLAEGDQLEWVDHHGFLGIILLYTANKWFTCMFENGQSVTFQTRIKAIKYCCDADRNGITLVLNTSEREQEAGIEIHRIDSNEYTHRKINDYRTEGVVLGTFLEKELVGWVLSSPGSNFAIVLVDWHTGKYARINTGIPQHGKSNEDGTGNFQEIGEVLTVCATKKELLIGYEGVRAMQVWIYSLDSLRECLIIAKELQAPRPILLHPQEIRQVLYIEQGIFRGSDPYPSFFQPSFCGLSWTGSQSFFDLFEPWNQQQTAFAYAPLPDEEHPGVECSLEDEEIAAAEQFLWPKPDGTKKTRYISRKSFVYTLPESTGIAVGCDAYYLYDVGLHGKNGSWVEKQMIDGRAVYKCRLANFNREDTSEEIPVSSSAVSTIDWEPEGCHWSSVKGICLDDSMGVLTVFTARHFWLLYFD